MFPALHLTAVDGNRYVYGPLTAKTGVRVLKTAATTKIDGVRQIYGMAVPPSWFAGERFPLSAGRAGRADLNPSASGDESHPQTAVSLVSAELSARDDGFLQGRAAEPSVC
jgi:hypothetical protein